MRNGFKLNVHLNLVRYSGQTVLNVQVEPRALRDWLLGLCLLKEGLTETFRVRQEGTERTVQIQLLGRQQYSRSRASLDRSHSRVTLAIRDFDYVLHFFLKYYRDGVAEVDHVDVDVEAAGDDVATVTFKVFEAVEPLDPEEAMRRLEGNERRGQ